MNTLESVKLNIDIQLSYNFKGDDSFIEHRFNEFHDSYTSSTKLTVLSKSLEDLKNWNINNSGNLAHSSNKFFSIKGLKYNSNYSPIIDQPEIGILGILCTHINGILHFLVQLKDEPGNLLRHQLSPTVQATKSNYTLVHGGRVPAYLEYFINNDNSKFLFDQYFSEQGFRYFRKRNRNMIVYVDNNISIFPGYIWMTLGQIYDLASIKPLFINACLRSVLSMLPKKMFSGEFNYLKLNTLISKIVSSKERFTNSYEICSLDKLPNWEFIDGKWKNIQNNSFSIIGVETFGNSREIGSWDQPLLSEDSDGQYGLIVGYIDNKLHCFWKISNEPGLIDGIELGPSWIVRSGDSTIGSIERSIFEKGIKILEILLPEEGGRFFHSNFLHTVINIGDVSHDVLGNSFIALDAFDTYFANSSLSLMTIEARSLWFVCKNEWFC